MKPDLTNNNGVAALFVSTVTQHQQGMNYILATDGTGLLVENESGAAVWRTFTALPAAVDIAEVAEWTPWTLFTNDGVWWMRSTSTGTWIAAATGNETDPETLPPRGPGHQLPAIE
jgi:hypothetical protein